MAALLFSFTSSSACETASSLESGLLVIPYLRFVALAI